jgi:hypothetical protein
VSDSALAAVRAASVSGATAGRAAVHAEPAAAARAATAAFVAVVAAGGCCCCQCWSCKCYLRG